MKTIKKTVFALALIVAAGAALTSCKKIVSGKKLDGAWSVTSGTISNEYKTDDYTSKSTSTFDGSEMETTTTTSYTGYPTTTVINSSEITIDYTFDKKTGEYTMTTVSTSEYEDGYGSYYEYDANTYSYIYTGNYERTNNGTSTETEEGLFTITGNAGDDIEANSQVVFQRRSGSETYTATYTYKDDFTNAAVNTATFYEYVYVPATDTLEYKKLQTSAQGSRSFTGAESDSPVWTVTELKKGEMMVESIDMTDYSDNDDSDNDYTSESTINWTLTQK
jgi:hypothetical protein